MTYLDTWKTRHSMLREQEFCANCAICTGTAVSAVSGPMFDLTLSGPQYTTADS